MGRWRVSDPWEGQELPPDSLGPPAQSCPVTQQKRQGQTAPEGLRLRAGKPPGQQSLPRAQGMSCSGQRCSRGSRVPGSGLHPCLARG